MTSGIGASSRLPCGRGWRTGHRSVMVTVTPSTVAIGSSGPIRAWRREPADRAGEPGRHGYVVRRAAGVGCDGEHRAGRDGFADPVVFGSITHCPPTPPSAPGVEPLGPVEQRAQQAVEHAAEQPRSERRRERSTMTEDRRARTHSARVLVDLDDHTVPGERDHLARQAALTDLDEVEQTPPRRSGPRRRAADR